jgi:uncharacterized membrane protein
MWLWWILIIVAVGVVIWFVVSNPRRGRGESTESPEQALKRRYANGEIDRKAYERMLSDLRK